MEIKRILGVVRASSDRQDTSAQKQQLEQFILSKCYKREQIDWLEAHVSSTRNLDVYQKLLDQIVDKCTGENACKAVAFWHLNRLGRKETFLIRMKEFFIENKIQMYCREPDFQLLNEEDGSENAGASMLYTLYTQIIAGDNRERAEKFKRGKDYARSLGRYVGGNVLYGYMLDELRRFVPNPEEAPIVQRVFDMYNTGKESCQSIANTLNRENILKRGKLFKADFINDIINNRGYAGDSNFGNNNYPAIISLETWANANEMLHNNRSVKSKETVNCNLCNQLIVCDRCGHKYFADAKHYACVVRRQWKRYDVTEPCSSPTINKLMLDEAVWNLTINIQSHNSLKAEDNTIQNIQNEIDKLIFDNINIDKKINAIKSRLKKLVDMFSSDDISEEEYKESRKKRQIDIKNLETEKDLNVNQIEMLNSRINVLKQPVTERWNKSIDDLKKLDWKNQDKYLCRELVRASIKHIRVSVDEENYTLAHIVDLFDRLHIFRYKLRRTPDKNGYIAGMFKSPLFEYPDRWTTFIIVDENNDRHCLGFITPPDEVPWRLSGTTFDHFIKQ